MLITVFYDRKNFFNQIVCSNEDTIGVYDTDNIKQLLNMCLPALNEVRFKNGFSVDGVAIDEGGIRYLIERSDEPRKYKVTKSEIISRTVNTEVPVKMTARQINSLAVNLYRDV